MASTSNVQITIALQEPDLDDDELQAQTQRLLQQMLELDEVEDASLFREAEAPVGSKSLTGLAVGWLTAQVNAKNIKALMGFLGDRLGNKTIELEIESNGKKLKDENITPIENRIKAEIETYMQKLQQYDQALIQTIQHEYPFSEEIREELKRYQHVLDLRDEEVARIEAKVIQSKQTNQSQTQLLNTSKLPVILPQSPIFSSQLIPNQKTQVIRDTEPAKTPSFPLQWIVPLIIVILSGSLGLFIKQLRFGMFSVGSSNPTTTPNPTIEATPVARSLANLSPGWVIKNNNQISLGNNQSLPPGAFLEVINTKPNPKPTSGNFSVSMRVCANKSTQTPANTSNPLVTSSISPNSKPLPSTEKTVLLDLSQLRRFGVSVLQSDAPSPCRTVTQSPVTEPPDTSPT
ncbi:hypothetical protein [Nostoc sp.]|uniref:hypothetical protein n=1 Tax=Nostoc sp. TaxID=1180 RepID=UPI002FFBAECF